MTFSAVILAGGRSTRMGRDKAWLPFNGKPLVEHTLHLVRDAGASEVLISGRAGQDFSGLGCPVLKDVIPDRGPLGGIDRGLAVAKHPLVLVLAVDLPHMTSACLRWIASFCGADSGAVPVLRDRFEPLAAFYPKGAHGLLDEVLRTEPPAARRLAAACFDQGLACRAPVPAAHDFCFSNWNTPEDAGG